MGKEANNHGIYASVVQPRRRESLVGIHWESNFVCGHNPATACPWEAMRMEIEAEALLIAETVSIEYLPLS
jgi:hypothetical protein